MYSTKSISYFRCYSVSDLSLLLKKSDKTIFKFIKAGLQTIDQHTPYMIRGYDLIMFLKKLNDSRKCVLASDQFYCLGCKEPQNPKHREIIIMDSGANIMAKAVCPDCGKVMNRPYKITDISALKKIFTIKDKLCIYDSDNTPLNFQNQTNSDCPKKGTEQLCLQF